MAAEGGGVRGDEESDVGSDAFSDVNSDVPSVRMSGRRG